MTASKKKRLATKLAIKCWMVMVDYERRMDGPLCHIYSAVGGEYESKSGVIPDDVCKAYTSVGNKIREYLLKSLRVANATHKHT